MKAISESNNREQFIEGLEDLGVEVDSNIDGVFVNDMFVRDELLPDLLELMKINEKLDNSQPLSTPRSQ